MYFDFNFRKILVLLLLSLVLILSWVHNDLTHIWKSVDVSVFYTLNSSLEGNTYWSMLWAFLSLREADIVAAIVIFLFFYSNGVVFNKEERLKGFIGFVTLLFVMLIVRELVDLFVEIYKLNRPSPSLVLDSSIRLSELYPTLHPKDASPASFPGDHAAVLFTWFGYCIYFAKNKWSLAILFATIFFALPRLIAGAHWFSDVAVGGLSIALISISFGLYTPLLNKVNSKLTSLLSGYLFK